ncbi:MAG TPA: ATPase domain-containing protein [Candidatus Didemnitutus sp.]|nr:ATPase domain-containing protein [Candidatus Didemnitutus sp.]
MAKTGIGGLDDILHGGLTPHRLYLLEGEPGSGKTTLALQYLMEGRRDGEKGLYLTLSETAEELAANAGSHGWSLEGIDVVEIGLRDGQLDAENTITMFNPSEVELGETIQSVLAAVERVNPSRVVFDSLSEMRLLAQNSLRYRRQIMALKQFFVGRECTVLLLEDGTTEAPDPQLQSIAHGVITLAQLSPDYGGERRRLRVTKFRGGSFRGGYHDFVIVRGGLKVFPRLVSAEHRQAISLEPIKSGVDSIDAMLGGGPDRGTSTLFVGPAGSGKSTMAIQYTVAAARRGEHCAVFAFDESTRTLAIRSKALGLEYTEGNGPGQIAVRQVDPAELSPGEFVHLVREAVEVRQARVVVIDSLNGYLNAMPQERHLSAQLHELLAYLGEQGVCTIMVVAQHGMIGQGVESPVDTSYLADCVVFFRFFEFQGEVRRAVSVLKKRSGKHEHSIRELKTGTKGLELSAPLTNFQGVLTGVPVMMEKPSLG